MADTKRGRDKQARDAEKRQHQRDIEAARERGEETEPARTGSDEPPACRRRGCDEPAAFVVFERYQEETGHGAVVAEAFLCRSHTAEESPTNLDGAYADYVFRVEPISAADVSSDV